jgi:hypothetical protein
VTVLKPEIWPLWLGEQLVDAPRFKSLLAPCLSRRHNSLVNPPALKRRAAK